MGFLLNLDEWIVKAFASPAVKHILDSCEPFPLFDLSEVESFNDKWILEEFHEKQKMSHSPMLLLRNIFPAKLFMVLLLTFAGIGHYYYGHCEWRSNRWVSRPLHVPKTN